MLLLLLKLLILQLLACLLLLLEFIMLLLLILKLLILQVLMLLLEMKWQKTLTKHGVDSGNRTGKRITRGIPYIIQHGRRGVD